METWQSCEYLVPGVLLMTNRVFPAGSAARFGLEPALDQAVMRSLSWQAVTPTTDTTTRYFFAVAVKAGPRAEMGLELAFKFSSLAFEEDRVVIEAQQKNLRATHDHMMLAGHDEAPVKFRRILARVAEHAAQD